MWNNLSQLHQLYEVQTKISLDVIGSGYNTLTN